MTSSEYLRRLLARTTLVAGVGLAVSAVGLPALAQDTGGGRAAASAGVPEEQNEELPSAKEVLNKYIEATGGEEAYQELKSQRATGTFALPMAGMEGKFELYQKSPDKFLVVVDLPGMGQVQNGVNGDIAWSVDPMGGPRLLEGEELRAAKREADMDLYLNPDKHYEKMEVKGTEEVRGEKAYHLVMTPKEGGKPVEAYFSAESGLMLKQVVTQESPMGEMKAENFLEDYRETADGKFKQPHKLVTRAGGQEFVITLERIEANAEIDDSRFEPPQEVKRLAERNRQERANDGQDNGGM